MSSDPETAVALLAGFLAYAGIVSSAEFASMRALVAPGGLLDWEVLQTRTRLTWWASRWATGRGALVGAQPASSWLVLCGVRAAASLLAVPFTGAVTSVTSAALVVLGVTTYAVMYRTMFGLDGSDQMLALLATSSGVVLLLAGEGAFTLVCWFATLLTTVAYVTAAVTKLGSRAWRGGDALALVVRTEVYGNPALLPLARTVAGRIATRSVIAIEMAFVLVYLGSPAVTWVVLGSLVVFHISSALLMGLNCFLPVFVSTFGCVAWVSASLW